MLTDGFYTALAAALRGSEESAAAFFIAVGAGSRAWDEAGLPPVARTVGRLAAEVARLQVRPEDVVFLDDGGEPSRDASPRLRLSATFAPGVATGTLRECGLFGGDATGARGSGTLLSYFPHPRVDKDGEMALARTFTLDLTPGAIALGSVETRWLGNTRNQEVHDLERVTGACQVDEIRFDRRHFFASPDEALAAGYDRCAFCFGRELSVR